MKDNTSEKKNYMLLIDSAATGVEFALDLAGQAAASLIPGAHGIYSAIKQRRVERNFNAAIDELRKKNERLELIIQNNEDKQKHGEHIVEYLESIGDESDTEKIKYYCESLVSSLEGDYLKIQRNMYLNTLRQISSDELRFLLKSYIEHTQYKRRSVGTHYALGSKGVLRQPAIYERLHSLGLIDYGDIDLHGNAVNYIPSGWGIDFSKHLLSDDIDIEAETNISY